MFLGIIHALKKRRHYLHGKPFVLYTDHQSLSYILGLKELTGRLARWLDVLANYHFEIRYIQGPKNVVADCLSRKDIEAPTAQVLDSAHLKSVLRLNRVLISVEISPDPTHLTQLQSEYRQDSHFAQIYRILRREEEVVPPKLQSQLDKYTLVDDLLYYQISPADDLRLCIPEGLSRRMLLQNVHDSNAGGHRGAEKTYEALVLKYYWFRLHRTCKRYVARCKVCQQNKTSSRTPVGLLMPLPVPLQRWQDLSLDFVSGFGPGDDPRNEEILVVLDRLTKMCHLIPTSSHIKSDDLAQLLLRHVFSLHGFPLTIVSDQDKLLRPVVWGAYRDLWDIESRFAVRNHPQTDGQTERTIRAISDIARTIINKPGQVFKWDTLLPMIEFAYNNSTHSAIGTTPFFANYGFHPRFVTYLPEPNWREKNAGRVAAQCFAMDQQTILHQVRDMMAESQNAMAEQANRHRQHLVFAVGDEVLVKRDALALKSKANSKFTILWYGPVKVTRVISENAYELALPAHLHSSRQSKAYNVNSLKPFVPLAAEFERLPPLLAAEIVERAVELTAISDVTAETVHTHWADTLISCTILLQDYEQLPLAKRLALENAYNSRVPPEQAFHSNRGSFQVSRQALSNRRTVRAPSRLQSIYDPPRVRGRTSVYPGGSVT